MKKKFTLNNLRHLAEVLGGKVRGNKAQCHCPMHDDGAASMSVTLDDDGKLWVFCHAGCDTKELSNMVTSMIPTPTLTALKGNKKTPTSTKGKTPDAIYRYVDENGVEVFRKLRYDPIKEGEAKTFRVVRNVDGEEKAGLEKGKEYPLYNQYSLAHAPKDMRIAICEGEKDCETIKKLDLGIIAVTNHGGGASWHAHHNKWFDGRDVLIFEDNDKVGRERTELLIGHLSAYADSIKVISFPELEEKGDVTDFIGDDILSGRRRLQEKIAAAAPLPVNKNIVKWAPSGFLKHAVYQDHIDLIKALPKIKGHVRDFLSDELMFVNEAGKWDYAANYLPYIKSHARTFGDYFKVLKAFDEHMERWRLEELEPRLRIDIPEWDGRDRIKEQAECFRFTNVTPQEFEELVKQWGAGIFRRLEDSYFQNSCLILQGPQGCGKDALTESWLGGLKDYKKALHISKKTNDEEVKRNLHTALVFIISEFEKTARADTASLRDILTQAYTDVRLSYDRRQAKRDIHASFIASCNDKNVFNDYTGNRRYWMIECEYLGLEILSHDGGIVGTGKVEKVYPGVFTDPHRTENQIQILAQFKHLASQRYEASQKTLDKIRQDIAERTPEDPNAMIFEAWEDLCGKAKEKAELCEGTLRWFDINNLREETAIIVRAFGLKSEYVLRRMLSANYKELKWTREGTKRLYRSKKLGADTSGIEIEELW